jgi:hypothetical protein
MGTDDAFGDRLDPEDFAFCMMMAKTLRLGAAESLLAGNDVGCFSTEQYQKAYDRQAAKAGCPARLACQWRLGLVEMHLRSIPELVREVRPGVWASVKTEGGERG